MSYNPSPLIRSVHKFFSGTLLSRLTGLARDMAMAFIFGSHPAVAAFMMAFRFSNLLRRVLGEGAMQAAFIPHFEEIKTKNHQSAARFFRDLNVTVTWVLLLVVVFAELVMGATLYYGRLGEDNRQILILTALMAPSILFICLFGIKSSFLQCENVFFSSSVAPALFNLVWIIALLMLQGMEIDRAMQWLSVAMVIAAIAQWGVTVPYSVRFLVKHLSWNELRKVKLFSQEVKGLVKPLMLGILGISAAQINSALDVVFARVADLNGPTYLWYALRIQQLPLALFGIAFSATMLPALSRAFKNQERVLYVEQLASGMRRSMSLMIPCAWFILALGGPSINLLYGRGDFTNEAGFYTMISLWAYGLGVVPQAAVVILAAALYAMNGYSVTTRAALIALGVNSGFNALFVFGFHWGAGSVALATSVATFSNMLFLSYPLWKKLCSFKDSIVNGVVKRESLSGAHFFIKINACGFFATAVALAVGLFFPHQLGVISLWQTAPFAFDREFTLQFLTLFCEGGAFAGALLVSGRFFKIQELTFFPIKIFN